MMMITENLKNGSRPSAESLLAKLEESRRARLRIYIGAAPGVGKTYEMLQDAHILRKQGYDVAVGFVETYGRADTQAKIGDLEIIPRKKIDYRGVILEEMNYETILDRKPQICIVDELAHSNVPGSRNRKRFEDVLDFLDAGIHVMTAVNIQHLETLNDAVARSSGIRVRETVPDSFLKRADEVVNVDVTMEELRNRLRQGKIYKPEKIEQALTNFFRKGNLSTLRELALRAVAEEVGSKAAQYREREGLDPAQIPEKVMVCISSAPSASKLLRNGARIAGRLGSVWYVVYVESPEHDKASGDSSESAQLTQNIALAEELGATVVKLKARKVADALIDFARREGITHVIFGQSARSRWKIFLKGSIINRFLGAVKDAAVQVIPPEDSGRK
jgi:two-component system sensor histidine kinase KdpD